MSCKLNANHTLLLGFSEVLQTCFDTIDSDSQIVLRLADPDNNGLQIRNLTSVIFSNFLNTSRTGSAHRHAGISIRTFLSSMAVSIIYFLVQVLFFTVLRGKFKYIYQALTLQGPAICYEKESLLKKAFAWISTVVCTPSDKYRDRVGLDAYFFLRFLQVMALFFLTLSLLIMPVLLPINYRSSSHSTFKHGDNKMPWLDRMNMSNLVAQKSGMLVFHLILSSFVVVWFHALLFKEFRFVHQLVTPARSSKTSAILIEDLPESMRGNKAKITTYLNSVFPQSAIDVKFLPKSCQQIQKMRRKMLKTKHDIERTVMTIIMNKFFTKTSIGSVGTNNDLTGAETNRALLCANKWLFYSKTPGRYFRCVQNVRISINGSCYRRCWPTIKFVPLPYIQQLYLDMMKSIRKYEKHLREWNQKCTELVEWKLIDRNVDNKGSKNEVYLDKVLVQVSSLNLASAVENLLRKGSDPGWKKTLVVPELGDIIWSNINSSKSSTLFLRSTLADILGVLITIGYILPVALVGLITQIPFIGSLTPLTHQDGISSEFFNEVMRGVVPVVTLIFLTEFVPFIFRWFSYLRCRKSGAAIETDTQNWFFAFLFVHIFLVVTISSSLSIVVEKLVNSPVSITTMLAHDLPKSSNFFCSFTLLRGLAYSGGNLLQPKELLVEIYHKLRVYTPHERVKRMKNVPCFQWGSIYPIFSVLGSIGIVYSVISPLILPLSCIAFSLVMFSFKYLYEFQYQGHNKSETWGKLYSVALMQLYAGIYCMEFCMIGLLALANCYILCFLKGSVIGLTIIAHCKMSSLYISRLDKFSFTEYQQQFQQSKHMFRPDKKHLRLPFIECEKKLQIWIPKDREQIAKKEKDHLENLYGIECYLEEFHISQNGTVSHRLETSN